MSQNLSFSMLYPVFANQVTRWNPVSAANSWSSISIATPSPPSLHTALSGRSPRTRTACPSGTFAWSLASDLHLLRPSSWRSFTRILSVSTFSWSKWHFWVVQAWLRAGLLGWGPVHLFLHLSRRCPLNRQQTFHSHAVSECETVLKPCLLMCPSCQHRSVWSLFFWYLGRLLMPALASVSRWRWHVLILTAQRCLLAKDCCF